MKPYYEDDYVTLYHGNCLKIDSWLAADVLVTDPPYGIAFRSARRSEQDRFAAIAGDESVALRDEVLAKWGSRPALVFGTWRAERPANVRQRLIWAKGEDPGLGDLSMPWGFGDEEMYVLGEGWVGKRRTNVYRMPKVAAVNNHGHPTPKPIPLMESLLDDGTPPRLGGGRSVRRIGRNANRGAQPRAARDWRGARGTLLRGNRKAAREHANAVDRRVAAT